MSEKQRAFLKWAGGKYRLTPAILQHLPPDLPEGVCFVEPFVGAGSVFLNMPFERYLLADINPDLIHLFNTVKTDLDRYLSASEALFLHSKANSRDFYLERRTEFNLSQDPFVRSVLFLYLNRFGYNGLCRYNKKHEFNVPFGRYKKPYFPEKELRFFSQKAQKAEFICDNFQAIFHRLYTQPDNYLVYCDPPYAPLQQNSNFTQYAGGGFSLIQQKELALFAEQAQQQQIPVLISNHNTAFTRQIYQNAQLSEIKVQRSIGQKSYSRQRVSELFAAFY